MTVDDEFEDIETHAISEVTRVRFYRETWGELKEKHPEFSTVKQKQDIRNAIMNPSQVHSSRTSPGNSFVFADHSSTYRGNILVVPVRVVENTSARAITAYYRGVPFNAATLLWRVENG